MEKQGEISTTGAVLATAWASQRVGAQGRNSIRLGAVADLISFVTFLFEDDLMMQSLRPAQITVAVLAALIWAINVRSAPRAQDPRPTFKTGVAVVPITAVVRDSRDRVVRNLARDDFHVFENSQPRPIVDFRSTDNASLSIAVLLDTSGSMRGPSLDRGKAFVDALLRKLNPVTDEAALFTFDKRLRQETPFTADAEHVWTALNSTNAWGLTSLYDAVAETAKRLGDRQRVRRAVIVVTDGLDTSSSLTSSQVTGIASAIDVPVYIVTVVPPLLNAAGDEIDGDLSSLAYAVD